MQDFILSRGFAGHEFQLSPLTPAAKEFCPQPKDARTYGAARFYASDALKAGFTVYDAVANATLQVKK